MNTKKDDNIIEIQSDRLSRHIPDEAIEVVPTPPSQRITVSYFVWLELYNLKKHMQEAEGAPRKVTYSDVIEGLLRRPEQ